MSRRSTVAGVRFRNAGKIQYFDTAGMRLEAGEYVVVETSRGPEIGRVVIAPDQVVVNELGDDELRPILRLATEADIRKMDALRSRAHELLPELRRLATDVGFPAHIDAADYTLDGRRLTLSFTSEERIDYRDFLRKAAERAGVKVDMRQMGARDRAKLAGGYGICGRELCCSNWLTTFPSISIRMAKEQEFPLNPQKISGLCGRLLCCLSYEEDGYREMRRSLPKLGQRCSTPTGEGKVVALNILRRQVTLVVEGQRIEVGDRDLGTVVRWNPASKAGEPPPSISRVEAIAQGLIEADEQDLRAAEEGDEAGAWGMARQESGRGRLPGGGPRRVVPPRQQPAAVADAPAAAAPQRGRGRGPGQRDSAAAAPAPGAARGQRDRREGGQRRDPGQGPAPSAPSRNFERRAPQPPPSGTPEESAPAADGAVGGAGAGRRRRGRRGGRGRGSGQDAPSPEE